MMQTTQTLSFPINNWGHLYSLQQAVSHNDQLTGRKLSLHGRILNNPFLNNVDTNITLEFIQSDTPPLYTKTDNALHILGDLSLTQQHLISCIQVDRSVFEEMRRNLMEYADIEGIHIMVSLDVLSDVQHWPANKTLKIVQLNYAMKGDG